MTLPLAPIDTTPATTGATGIGSSLSRVPTRENLVRAGQQFESVFTAMMLKSMRQAKLAEPLFDSQALDTFRDMQDQKLVQSMAEHTPLGIGKAMTDFLARGMPAPPPDAPAAAADTTPAAPPRDVS